MATARSALLDLFNCFFFYFIYFTNIWQVGGRTYSLGTQTMEDLEAWMKLIACASFDYMKLMVVELQQQLAEVNSPFEDQSFEDFFSSAFYIFLYICSLSFVLNK